MKVIVDLVRCEGAFNCLASAPQVFDLDADSGKALVLLDDVPEDQHNAVGLAVRNCPNAAITTQE